MKINILYKAKKSARDFQIASNDLHAWATVPVWLFEKITGMKLEDLQEQYGTQGMKEYFRAIIHTVVEHHKPEQLAPVFQFNYCAIKR